MGQRSITQRKKLQSFIKVRFLSHMFLLDQLQNFSPFPMCTCGKCVCNVNQRLVNMQAKEFGMKFFWDWISLLHESKQKFYWWILFSLRIRRTFKTKSCKSSFEILKFTRIKLKSLHKHQETTTFKAPKNFHYISLKTKNIWRIFIQTILPSLKSLLETSFKASKNFKDFDP